VYQISDKPQNQLLDRKIYRDPVIDCLSQKELGYSFTTGELCGSIDDPIASQNPTCVGRVLNGLNERGALVYMEEESYGVNQYRIPSSREISESEEIEPEFFNEEGLDSAQTREVIDRTLE